MRRFWSGWIMFGSGIFLIGVGMLATSIWMQNLSFKPLGGLWTVYAQQVGAFYYYLAIVLLVLGLLAVISSKGD